MKTKQCRPKFSFLLLVLIASLLSSLSCDKKLVKREYVEITESSPLTAMSSERMRDTHANIPDLGNMSNANISLSPQEALIAWTTPQAWRETAGSGFRLVSFKSKDNQEAIDCSVVVLDGDAGGLQANVVRWMRQIDLGVPDGPALGDFLNQQKSFQTRDNLTGRLIDFRGLQAGVDAQTRTALAAVINLPHSVVFVKMTGSINDVTKNEKYFNTFLQSLRKVQ